MDKKQTSRQNFSHWLTKHYKEILTVSALLAVAFILQLIGCNETVFSFQEPARCADIDLDSLVDAVCEGEGIDVGIGGYSGGPDGGGGYDDDPEGGGGPEGGDGRDLDRGSGRGGSGRDRSRGRDRFFPEYTVRLGKVDILFAVDNSSSMAVEHDNIADQFEQFMEDIKHLNYRIAMVTVDISSSPNNLRRKDQDGRFVRFKNRDYFLYNYDEEKSFERASLRVKDIERRHRDNINAFKKAIRRAETRSCDQDPDYCPDDERAICALNMAFDHSNQSDFFRKDSHLMVIVISDEDERSSFEVVQAYADRGNYEYEYESCDWPDTFYRKVKQRLGSYKTLSVHAIIIKPGDDECLRSQQEEDGDGYYGQLYAKFARPPKKIMKQYPNLKRGSVNSICDRNYDDQMGVFASYLKRDPVHTLPCMAQKVEVFVKGTRDRVRHTIDGQKLTIEESLPMDTELRVRPHCEYSVQH